MPKGVEMPVSSDHPLRSFPVIVEMPILWGYMDSFQHVNNTVYFRFFESARIAYGDRVAMDQVLREKNIGPILAATSCKFIRPLRYPDTVEVGCRTTKLTSSELQQKYTVYSQRMNKVAAVGTAKVVAYHYEKLKRTEFPQALIDGVLELEKDLRLT